MKSLLQEEESRSGETTPEHPGSPQIPRYCSSKRQHLGIDDVPWGSLIEGIVEGLAKVDKSVIPHIYEDIENRSTGATGKRWVGYGLPMATISILVNGKVVIIIIICLKKGTRSITRRVGESHIRQDEAKAVDKTEIAGNMCACYRDIKVSSASQWDYRLQGLRLLVMWRNGCRRC